MLPKKLLKCLKSVFSGQAGYLNICNSCCSTMHRRGKGSSSFRQFDDFYSGLTSRFDAAADANDNDTVNLQYTTEPKKASLERKRNKGGKKKVKIQTSDPNSRNSERKCLEIGPGGDQGGNGLAVEKLKEMKMMDARNSEHLRDIEEIIYYYSLITSQTYLEIVDKFFADLYSQFSDSPVFPGSGGGHRLVKV